MAKIVDPKNAGKGEYSAVIKQTLAEGKCPFCPGNFKYHKEPILKENGGWLLTRNSWPYQNSRDQFLVICKSHKEQIGEMTAKDWADINHLLQWAVKEFKVVGGAFAMRFGDTAYTGASVCHLHGQFIIPDIGNTKHKNTARPISEEEFDNHPDAVWFRVG